MILMRKKSDNLNINQDITNKRFFSALFLENYIIGGDVQLLTLSSLSSESLRFVSQALE